MNKLLRIFYTTKNLLVTSHFDKDFIKSSILLINILPRANIENILSCSFNKEIVLETIKSITHDYNLIINEYIENHIDPYIKHYLCNKRYTTDFYRATAGQRGALIFFSIGILLGAIATIIGSVSTVSGNDTKNTSLITGIIYIIIFVYTMASIGYLTIRSNAAKAWNIDKQHIEALINLMQARLDGINYIREIKKLIDNNKLMEISDTYIPRNLKIITILKDIKDNYNVEKFKLPNIMDLNCTFIYENCPCQLADIKYLEKAIVDAQDGVTVGFLQASSGRDRAGTSPANMIFFRPERTQNSVTRRRMSSARINIE